MDLIAWILLLVLFVLWLQMRGRVAELMQRIDALETRRIAHPEPVAARAERGAAAVVLTRPEPVPAAPPEPVAAPVPAEPVAPPPAPREPEAHTPEPKRAVRSFSFEDVFGRHLPIWAGGITLIVAGVLIVKYSIDAGLLSPLVRVIAGLIFGTTLIAGAEAALRSERLVRDRRVAQSLAGAGIATLYAAILIAANLYHLIVPGAAFAGLIAVTLLAAGLSLRFGAPSALLGLVGGLAAPALVGAQSPNVPLLAIYLAFIVGGLAALGRNQRWPWLGLLAIAGGFGWSLVLLLSGATGPDATIAIGLFTLLLAVAFPLLLVGEAARWLRLAAALAGCVQMAALVATGGFAALDWGLYGLIAAAIVWLSRREPMLADAPLAGIATGLLLAFAWQKPDTLALAAVLAGGALIHGVPALLRLWRSEGRLGDAAQIAVATFGIAVVPYFHFEGLADDRLFGATALLGAAIAGGAAALGWRNAQRSTDARFAILTLTSAGLAVFAAPLLFTDAVLAPATAVIALATLLLARRAEDQRVDIGAQLLALFALLTLGSSTGTHEIVRALGGDSAGVAIPGLARWAVVALAAAGFARWSTTPSVRQAAAGFATALGYVALAQVVPHAAMPLIPAAMLALLAFAPLPSEARTPAQGTAGAIAFGWALEPLMTWLVAGLEAAGGTPLEVTALPGWRDALINLGAPALALAGLHWRHAVPDVARRYAIAALAVLAVITAHLLWKQVFAIATPQSFTDWGMAERTLWELLLLATAFGAWKLMWRTVALGLAGCALAHFAWFTLLLHDPLWSAQAVGPWLLPAYAGACAATWLVVRLIGHPAAARIETGVRIALILFFAASALRQIFHGPMLSAGVGSPGTELEFAL